ncbi:hypothetical protein ABZ297_25315 [Nonomuraea sp. NPDC005983]|uniref:hypothetical protein n=1 Tax=Nonomuraea sp. NPDC005983 TaxID=3155595 RepID=UPI0033A4C4A9
MAGVVAGVLMVLPGSRDFGVEGLWPEGARVSLDGVLTRGTEVVQTKVHLSLYNAGQAPVIAVLSLLTWMPGALTALLVCFSLRRITRHCRFSDRALFSQVTISQLRRIGAVLVIGSLVSFLLDAGAKAVATRMMMNDGYVLPSVGDLPVLAVFAGVGVFAVAEVIRRGMVMFDELEGTI